MSKHQSLNTALVLKRRTVQRKTCVALKSLSVCVCVYYLLLMVDIKKNPSLVIVLFKIYFQCNIHLIKNNRLWLFLLFIDTQSPVYLQLILGIHQTKIIKCTQTLCVYLCVPVAPHNLTMINNKHFFLLKTTNETMQCNNHQSRGRYCHKNLFLSSRNNKGHHHHTLHSTTTWTWTMYQSART